MPSAVPPLGYVSISSRGAVTSSPRVHVAAAKPDTFKRGLVKGLSAKSAARLRRFLVEHGGPPDTEALAFTCTVPGPVLEAREWRRAWHAYHCRLVRCGVPVVWRVELQRRKQAHVHCVAWVRPMSGGHLILRLGWESAVRLLGPVRCPDGWGRSGITYADSRMELPGADLHAYREGVPGKDWSRWWRYLGGHSSKSKREQLGWQGRQWGVINRGAFVAGEVSRHDMTAPELARFVRMARRLLNLRRAMGRGTCAWFIQPASAARLVAWARGSASPAVSG